MYQSYVFTCILCLFIICVCQGFPQLKIQTCKEVLSKQMCAKCTSRARNAKSLAAGVQGPLKGPGSSEVLEALWCNIGLFFNTLSGVHESIFEEINWQIHVFPIQNNFFKSYSKFIYY